MVTYSVLAMLLLIIVGVRGEGVGLLDCCYGQGLPSMRS
jgi:hypothetical protein